jgi:hypothetical protein
VSFHPASTGPVQIVVRTFSNAAPVEIGRFALYPERRFSSAEPAKSQHFRLTIPGQLRLKRSSLLQIYIVPTVDTGEGASVEVLAGELR